MRDRDRGHAAFGTRCLARQQQAEFVVREVDLDRVRVEDILADPQVCTVRRGRFDRGDRRVEILCADADLDPVAVGDPVG